MVERLRRGEFGNTVRTWTTYESFVEDFDTVWYLAELGRSEGRDRLRMRTKVPGGAFITSVDVRSLSPERFETHYLSEATPDELTIIQGEFRDGDWDYRDPYFWCSEEKTHMVAALRGKHVGRLTGLMALATIQHHMDAESWDNFQRLRYDWPGHVIEFSVFGRPVGKLGWNTCFWECRDF